MYELRSYTVIHSILRYILYIRVIMKKKKMML